jgi:hypothetical protein
VNVHCDRANISYCNVVLRDFIKNNDTSRKEVRESIRIQARLLWFARDTIGDFHFLRLYLGEQQAPESLQQQQRVRI